MNDCLRLVEDRDLDAVLKIFNHHVSHSFAAYAENEFGPEVVDVFRRSASAFYVQEVDGEIAGFGFIRPYNLFENFNHTAMLTYFLLPEYTGMGLGTKLLNQLQDYARENGIYNLVAHISSKNQQSLNFHKKQGFEECGRLKNMGKKFGEDFDIVWVQKFID